jgi:hypothetical protein
MALLKVVPHSQCRYACVALLYERQTQVSTKVRLKAVSCDKAFLYADHLEKAHGSHPGENQFRRLVNEGWTSIPWHAFLGRRARFVTSKIS